MVGDNFDIPIMYQDLASYTMNPMTPQFGGITGAGQYGNTSYLGGIKMQQQPDSDKIQLMNKKSDEGISTAKKVGLGLAAVFLMGFIPKLFGKKTVQAQIADFYKAKSPQAKTWLSNLWTKIKGKPDKWNRFKNWSSEKWNNFKSIFHKKKAAAPEES